jgi:hypothetical protein
MRSKHQIFTLMLLFTVPVLLFISCGEDSEIFTPYEPTGNIEDYYSAQDTDAQVFERMASEDILIVTENNTIIKIPSYSMIDVAGNVISEGVRIEVIEVFEKGDMVLHKTSTMTSNAHLKSDGMFHIKVTKDGEEVKMKDGYNYKMYVPNKEPDPEMKLFFGDRVDEMVVWEEAVDQEIRVNEWQIADSTTVYFDFGYELFSDKFTWINIDKYYDLPDDAKTSVCVSLPEELYDHKNTVVLMIYKEEYSLIPFTFNQEDKLWCEPYAQVPKGWEIILVSISSLGEDEYHLGTKEATVVENDVFTIIPEIKTKEEIKEFLESL